MASSKRVWLVLVGVTVALSVMLLILRPWSNQPKPTGESTMVLVSPQEPSSLDPIRLLDVNTHLFVSAVHSTLCVTEPGGTVRPVLAEAIKMSDDGLTCNVVLRPQASFSDGSPVTSRDIEFSLRRLFHSGHPQRFIVGLIRGIETTDNLGGGFEIVDDRHLRIHFTKPEPDFPMMISTAVASIVKRPEGETPATQPYDRQLIGAGPYRITEIKPGQAFLLEANPGFPLTHLTRRMEIRINPNEGEQLAAFRRGEVNLVRLRGPMIGEACQLNSGGLLTPRSEYAKARLATSPGNEVVIILLNWKSPKLAVIPEAKRKDLLAALSKSIPRAQFIDSAYLGQARPCYGVAPGTGSPPAQQAASTPDVKPVEVELLVSDDVDARRLAGICASALQDTWLRPKTTAQEMGAMFARVMNGQFDTCLIWLEMNIPASGPYAWTTFFRSDSPFVSIGQPIQGTAERAEAARNILGRQERIAAYKATIDAINDAQVVWLPIISRRTLFLVGEGAPDVFLDVNGTIHFSVSTKGNQTP